MVPESLRCQRGTGPRQVYSEDSRSVSREHAEVATDPGTDLEHFSTPPVFKAREPRDIRLQNIPVSFCAFEELSAADFGVLTQPRSARLRAPIRRYSAFAEHALSVSAFPNRLLKKDRFSHNYHVD
jgi:hypothetical protein